MRNLVHVDLYHSSLCGQAMAWRLAMHWPVQFHERGNCIYVACVYCVVSDTIAFNGHGPYICTDEIGAVCTVYGIGERFLSASHMVYLYFVLLLKKALLVPKRRAFLKYTMWLNSTVVPPISYPGMVVNLYSSQYSIVALNSVVFVVVCMHRVLYVYLSFFLLFSMGQHKGNHRCNHKSIYLQTWGHS